jgi:succinate-semialdehyde dehydrogenase / glutarate-semialdehyde dehydrogenase
MPKSFWPTKRSRLGRKRSFIRYLPIGPILAIMPWNFPFWQVFRFVAPALMAGNVGLLKHASNVPQCALKIEDIVRRAGFAEGVFQTLLIGSGPVDGILNDPRVVAATLTGSEQAGIQVGISAAKRIKKVVLELGGSDPFHRDAERRSRSGGRDRGRCANPEQRSVVHRGQALHRGGKNCRRIRTQVRKAHAGVARGRSLRREHATRTTGQCRRGASLDADVKKTVAAGARACSPAAIPRSSRKFLCAHRAHRYSKGLAGAIRKNSLARWRRFSVKDMDQAIQIANDSRFGLGASAWTNDPAETERFINELEAGMVFLNKMVASDPRLPFGGVKYSGHGRELAAHGIREFVNIKTVWIQ